MRIASKKIRSRSITSELIAPCGMNCGLCWAFIREKTVCPGCYGDDELKAKTCAMCKIKNCASLNAGKLEYCFQCEQYPCAKIKHIDKRYRTKYGMSMIDNLEQIKRFGVDRFVEREKERWACPNCGELICVHKENCVYCGYKWH